jgi:hypothetical protein
MGEATTGLQRLSAASGHISRRGLNHARRVLLFKRGRVNRATRAYTVNDRIETTANASDLARQGVGGEPKERSCGHADTLLGSRVADAKQCSTRARNRPHLTRFESRQGNRTLLREHPESTTKELQAWTFLEP